MASAWAGVNSASVSERATAWVSSMRPSIIAEKRPTPKGRATATGPGVGPQGQLREHGQKVLAS